MIGRCGLLALALAAACSHAPAAPADRTLSLSLPDLTGHQVALPHDAAGKVVLLDVWATWCDPCRASLPAWQDMAARLGPGFSLYGIAVDDDTAAVAPFAQSLGLDFPVLLDPGAARSGRELGVDRIPTVILVDRSGRIRYERAGWNEKDASAVEAQVRALLAE